MEYKITFLDYWHLGSGASAGPTLDALVVKDTQGFPYVPGKTVKGLLREAVDILDSTKTKQIFGDEGSNIANSYFSNAELGRATKEALNQDEMLKKHLFSKVTSTKINERGITEDKTLREIEVVVPLTLYGTIECNETELIAKAMKMIKQMGLNRNRGLGRCKMEAIG